MLPSVGKIKSMAREVLSRNHFVGIMATLPFVFSLTVLLLVVEVLFTVTNTSIAVLFNIVMICFLVLPLALGTLRFFSRWLEGVCEYPTTVFFYFSSSAVYRKSVNFILRLIIRLSVSYFLLSLPAIIVGGLALSDVYEFFGFAIPLWTPLLFDDGFTSVMIDMSSKSFEENIEITRKVVEYAHDTSKHPYVTVEAELGTLAGIEDDVKVEHGNESYTRPEDVEEFVRRTGCDSLAIAIGTSHGAYKFKPEQCTRDPKTGVLLPPPLRFDILEEVSKRLPGFPIVLHGSSSVNQEYVKIINDNGGKLVDAVGVPESQLRQAARLAVCKINIDSDLRLAMTAGIREHFVAHPDHFDPRQYVGDGRAYVKEIVHDKIINVLGSDGKA